MPTAVLTETPTVTVDIGEFAQIYAVGNVAINTVAETSASSDANTAGGGIFSLGTASATTDINNSNSLVTVETGANIQAVANVTLGTMSNQSIGSTATLDGGGVISARLAEESSVLTGGTKTEVNGTVTAGQELLIDSHVELNGATSAESDSVGLGAGADADTKIDNAGLNLTDPSSVVIDPGPDLTGDSVQLYAWLDSLNASATASATAIDPIIFGVASAFADSILIRVQHKR